MSTRYQLYYTLNKNIKKSNLTKKQTNELISFLKSKLDDEKMKAIILLIIEHAKNTEQYEFDVENIVLPYEIYEKGGKTFFDIQYFPNDLKWILYKFHALNNTE